MTSITELLGCVCSRGSTSDKLDYSKVEEGEDEVSEVGGLFGIELFSSIAGHISVVKESCHTKQFMYPRH